MNQQGFEMGLLDGLAGQVLGSMLGGGQQQAGGNQLIEIVLNLIKNQPGGLGGLLQQFQNAGLGGAAASWVGSGPNEPVSGQDMSSALGDDFIGNISNQLGVQKEESAGSLAALLPELIDQLTPQGNVPDRDAMSGSLIDLAGKLLRG